MPADHDINPCIYNNAAGISATPVISAIKLKIPLSDVTVVPAAFFWYSDVCIWLNLQ